VRRTVIAAAAFTASLASLTGCSSTPVTDPTPTPTQSVSARVSSWSKSIVRISSESSACGEMDYGTGFAVDDNLVVTNAHVVAGAQKITVAPYANSEKLDGQLRYFDPRNDFAIIEVVNLNLPKLEISEDLQPNELVYAFGFNTKQQLQIEESIMTKEVVWNAKDIYGEGKFDLILYELKAHIFPGNSGGPLLDRNGKIHGVVVGRSSNTEELAFALTVKELKDALKNAPFNLKVRNLRCVTN